jgi:hypothetical protein
VPLRLFDEYGSSVADSETSLRERLVQERANIFDASEFPRVFGGLKQAASDFVRIVSASVPDV